MKIKITADRMIDLPKEELAKLDISTMSCYINMGGESYEDLINITPEDVFTHMRKTGEIAKTAAKGIEAYREFFEPFTGEGKAVIHFAASSGISAICDNAKKAAELLPNVYVIDTATLSSGIALLAKYALGLIADGEGDPKKIYDLCLEKRKKLQGSFIIETLECLHKGGRCGSLQYFAANLLKIRPVITLDIDTGKMHVREKHRGGYERAIKDYVKETFKKFPDPDLKQLHITTCSKDEKLVRTLLDAISEQYKFENIYYSEETCNCAVHSGPNAFGVFYFVK